MRRELDPREDSWIIHRCHRVSRLLRIYRDLQELGRLSTKPGYDWERGMVEYRLRREGVKFLPPAGKAKG